MRTTKSSEIIICLTFNEFHTRFAHFRSTGINNYILLFVIYVITNSHPISDASLVDFS